MAKKKMDDDHVDYGRQLTAKQYHDLMYNRGSNNGWNTAYKEMRTFLKEHPNASYQEMVKFCAGKMKAM